ncbi:hypothetical protein C8J26_2382 [Sphingomonas aurantiaca]|uniref:Uncharacterized protein n=1 Tax=Sphingomonas aurantiaca TaxID=185949 RepID=A0A2T5GJP3_9SPHN|nr:hypothetical protein [Sphingomonas aurantiaca]PTQ59536.1 hypothetical protein C8J26_2382 [Sphingomonas aurantiaca]
MATFTPEDQALLDELNYRKSFVAWQEREAARQARLAGLAALTSIFTAATVTPFATVSSSQSEALALSDPEVSAMLSNIATVMGYTGQLFPGSSRRSTSIRARFAPTRQVFCGSPSLSPPPRKYAPRIAQEEKISAWEP